MKRVYFVAVSMVLAAGCGMSSSSNVAADEQTPHEVEQTAEAAKALDARIHNMIHSNMLKKFDLPWQGDYTTKVVGYSPAPAENRYIAPGSFVLNYHSNLRQIQGRYLIRDVDLATLKKENILGDKNFEGVQIFGTYEEINPSMFTKRTWAGGFARFFIYEKPIVKAGYTKPANVWITYLEKTRLSDLSDVSDDWKVPAFSEKDGWSKLMPLYPKE